MRTKTEKSKKRTKELKNNVFSHMSLRVKLIAAFTVTIVFIIMIAGGATASFRNITHQIGILERTAKAHAELEQARVEQVRFEADKNFELSAIVDEHLETSHALTDEVIELMRSETSRAIGKEMVTAIVSYHEAFNEYVELERKKSEQSQIKTEITDLVIAEIRETLVLEEDYIHNLTDAQTIMSSYDKYVLLEKALDSFMQARVLEGKYIATRSEALADDLRTRIVKTREALTNAQRSIKAEAVLSKVNLALEDLDKYENAFEAFDALVQEQETAKKTMRSQAVIASETASKIETSVSAYIVKVENDSARMNLILPLIALIFSLIISALLTKEITSGIHAVVVNINALAEFDLTRTLPEALQKRRDEIGVLGLATHRISENLISIVETLSNASELLSKSAQELSSRSHITSNASNEIAKTVEEIAEGASDQARSTETGVWNVSELGELIEKDQVNVASLIESADQVSNLKEEGVDIVTLLVKETEQSGKASETVAKIVKETNTSAEKIESASQMIQNISDQTNLLALNAAIEAARAGDAGRGFAVVAEEIRHLAEQSSNFTTQILETIMELMMKAGEAVSTMEQSRKIANRQAKGVSDTNEKFQGIANAVEHMKTVIESIRNSSKTMEEKKAEIIGIMENLSSISEENAAATQQVSASVEEQTATISEINDAASDLAKLSEEVQKIISQFRI